MGSGGFALFGGPGCLTRPWAAARPRAVRAASFARRVDSLSGQAPPLLSNFARNSPASTSNIEFMSLELQRFQAIFKSDRGKLCAKCVWGGCVGSLSGQAPPPPTGTAARPRCRPRHSNFACNSPAACSNIEFASLELQRFLGLLKFGPIELHAKFVWRWPCEPVLALPTGRSPHRGRVLRLLGCLPLHAGGAWCAVVSARSISTSHSVQNSPCSASWWSERYKTLPACRNSAKLSHFGRAGRVLYRTCGEGGCAGRVLYRTCGEKGCAGRVLYRTCGERGCAGRVLSRRGKVWLLLGE